MDSTSAAKPSSAASSTYDMAANFTPSTGAPAGLRWFASNASQLSWIDASSGGSGWPSLVTGFASFASVRFVMEPATFFSR